MRIPGKERDESKKREFEIKQEQTTKKHVLWEVHMGYQNFKACLY